MLMFILVLSERPLKLAFEIEQIFGYISPTKNKRHTPFLYTTNRKILQKIIKLNSRKFNQ